jgi:hypothetical protein
MKTSVTVLTSLSESVRQKSLPQNKANAPASDEVALSPKTAFPEALHVLIEDSGGWGVLRSNLSPHRRLLTAALGPGGAAIAVTEKGVFPAKTQLEGSGSTPHGEPGTGARAPVIPSIV